MKQVKETLHGILIGILLYSVVVEGIGIFFSDNLSGYTFGLLTGMVFAILLLFHITYTLEKALDLNELQATKYTRKQSFLRLGIMLIALSLGLLFETITFIPLLLGLLSLKIGALMAPFFLRRIYPEDFVTKEENELFEASRTIADTEKDAM